MSYLEGQREIVEDPTAKPPLVFRCIDWRTNGLTTDWLAERGILEGTYNLFATAGASGNPHGFLGDVRRHAPTSLLVADHEDCGFYKGAGLYAQREDPNQAHHHNLETLGGTVHELNPNIAYGYGLIPLDSERRQQHQCPAVAIMLGQPKVVFGAREKLARLGLADHDEIARPYHLDPEDATIWNDLRISLRLHKPEQVYVFEANPNRALEIADIAQKIATEQTIVPVVIGQLSRRSSSATMLFRGR